MTWPQFLWLYSLVGAGVAAWLIKSGHPSLDLYRLLIAVAALAFLVDQPAESRGFWYFHPPLAAKLLDVPIANVAFAMVTAVLALLLRHQAARVFARRSRDQLSGQATRIERR